MELAKIRLIKLTKKLATPNSPSTVCVLSHLNSLIILNAQTFMDICFSETQKLGMERQLIALAYFANSSVLPSPPSTLLLEWHQI